MNTTRLTVVGMEAKIGPADDLDTFARSIYAGEPLHLNQERGADDLLARVIDRALDDAHLDWNQHVSMLTVDPESTPRTVFEALVIARQHLTSGAATSVVIAASDDGNAGAIVLQGLAYARAQTDRIYAVIAGLALEDDARSPEAVEAICRRAWAQTDLSKERVGYLELAGFVDPGHETVTIEGLRRAYRTPKSDLTCGLGSAVQDESAAPVAEMASLIKTILCLHQRFLPAQPDWRGPEAPERWQETAFYVNTASRPWFAPQGGRRVAALHSTSGESAGVHVLLSDEAGPRRDHGYLQHAAYFLPIAAESREALLTQLQKVERQATVAATQADLRALARRRYQAYQQRSDARYTLCLVGETREALLRDIGFAEDGVERAFDEQRPWQTPRGSYFTPNPLAETGAVAFVYPGAFNAYLNLGRDLFQLFPDLHEHFAETTHDLGRVVHERALYPRSLTPLSKAEQRTHEKALMAQPATLIESGTTFAMLFTAILRDYFGVRPTAALGYSLGEASMLWANEVWQDAEAGSRAWRDSPLFKTRLTGPKNAVREYWGLDATADDSAFWRTYLLKAPVDAIRAYVAEEPHVTLTMINTPREGVIAGDPAGCRRVIDVLDCHALPVPYDAVIHAEAMRSEHPAFVELYTNPVTHRPDVDFYSTAGYAPLTLTSDALAHALADMTCTQVNFPRLVQRAYDDGARIFVELGPQRTCTRWIDKILRGKPHAAMAINKKGGSDIVGILSVLAQLLSHGVGLDISRLNGSMVAGHEVAETPHATPAPALLGVADEAHTRYQIAAPHSRKQSEQERGRAAFDLAGRYAEGANAHQRRLIDGHGAFLQARQAALQETSGLIQMQIATYNQWLDQTLGQEKRVNGKGPCALFDKADLQAFATGSAAQCLGPAYAVYEGRRMPRIPNGDLLLMSRIVDVDGDQGVVQPGASLVSEYDVPADAWFYQQNAYPTLPYAVLMEIALQPCGFLSAYLGSTLRYPETDFYFRNLDGTGQLLAVPNLRGQTVTNRVQILSSTTMRGVILQQFTFALACEGETFYEGEASFGYFQAAALDKQAGLDGGASPQPWYRRTSAQVSFDELNFNAKGVRQRYYGAPTHRPHYRLTEGQLDLLNTVHIVKEGGEHGQGYVHAEALIDPAAWFFNCHFYQDPVMPGSLGVQAIQQALRSYAIHEGLGTQLRNPHFAQIPNHRTTWKYRGQIRPEDRALELEVHVREIEERADQTTVIGAASLWRDKQRIYEVNDVGICIKDTTDTAVAGL